MMMALSIAAIIIGLVMLIWSADRFVDGAAGIARYYGMPPLLIGIVVIGFGTSAPEMVVSAIAAWQGTPSLALGNAYGSNIANIGLIIGITALLTPLLVNAKTLIKEFPILLAITALAAWQVSDHQITRGEALLDLLLFAGIMGWQIIDGMRHPEHADIDIDDAGDDTMPIKHAWLWTIIGLCLLVLASRAMVWGASYIASTFGVSDLVIGLTVFAVGTSLPELASTLTAVRKQHHDMAIGNILGSNVFNTLAVVGIAGTIHPMSIEPVVFYRDIPVMAAMTVAFMLIARTGRINRWAGSLLLSAFIAYNIYLMITILPA